MKTRVLFMILLSAIVVSLSSCTRTEKRLVPGTETWDIPDYYVLKTKDGKTLWGLESANVKHNQRIVEMRIQPVWDSITDSKTGLGYIVQKDGLWYASASDFATPNTMTPGFTSFNVIHGMHPNVKDIWLLKSPEGLYACFDKIVEYINYGPYEDFFPSARGFFFKENGMWGYKENIPNVNNAVSILPAEYESIVEIYDNMSYPERKSYFIVKQDGKWSFINRNNICPVSSYYARLLFQDEKAVNISLKTLLNWYDLFTSEKTEFKWVQGAIHSKIYCTKHSSGEVGVMWDI